MGNAQRSRTFSIPAPRGDILDRNGEPLAVSLKSDTIWADPLLVTEPQKAARALSPILEMEYEDLYRRLTKPGSFSYLKRRVSPEVQRQVERRNLQGVYSYTEYKRNSPSGENLALSVLGYVGNEEQGLGGVEFTFEDVLAGKPGKVILEGNVRGEIVDPSLRYVEPAKPGNSLQLTIDKSLQYEAERLILNAVNDYSAFSGIILATKPGTGEILAMATAIRNEDEALVEDADKDEKQVQVGEEDEEKEGGAYISHENRAVSWAYEPGSVLKALTFSAVLEAGVGEPQSVKQVPDRYKLYDAEFSDHNPHPIQSMTISDIVTVSSNIGTILWAQDLGKTHLDFFYRQFGLGTLSNIEIPGESSGIVLNTKNYSGTSLATIPLGQGISVTPLQLLYGYNTIANGGVYVAPRLVLATANDDKWETHEPNIESRRVISQETADQMIQILKRVVDEGTGTRAAIDSYDIAGKTGTARKPQKGGGYLDKDGNFHYIATFAGFYPAENPQVSIVVVIEEPQNSIYASSTAAPVFAEFAAFIGGRLGIAPTYQEISYTQN